MTHHHNVGIIPCDSAMNDIQMSHILNFLGVTVFYTQLSGNDIPIVNVTN